MPTTVVLWLILVHVFHNQLLLELSLDPFNTSHMSLVTRKPVFGVCDQGRLKLICAATEASKRLEILDIETRGNILPRQQKRWSDCAGWSAPFVVRIGQKQVFSWRGSYILQTYWKCAWRSLMLKKKMLLTKLRGFAFSHFLKIAPCKN